LSGRRDSNPRPSPWQDPQLSGYLGASVQVGGPSSATAPARGHNLGHKVAGFRDPYPSVALGAGQCRRVTHLGRHTRCGERVLAVSDALARDHRRGRVPHLSRNPGFARIPDRSRDRAVRGRRQGRSPGQSHVNPHAAPIGGRERRRSSTRDARGTGERPRRLQLVASLDDQRCVVVNCEPLVVTFAQCQDDPYPL
jgi:hypothetical protein